MLIFSGYVIILPGTRVLGVSVGWMTPKTAATRLEAALDWSNRRVLLTGNGKARESHLASDLGIVPDSYATTAGCRRPIWSIFNRDMPLIVSADPDRLSAFAADLASQFNVAVADAKLAIGDGDRVVIVPDVIGLEVDRAALSGIFPDRARIMEIPETVEIPFKTVEPKVRASDLERFLPMALVSSYATHYADGNDRAFNIDLACASLQGLVVDPGGVFSFNSTVGARTQDRGYRKAPTFVGDETVDDYGGGVCQVSTTLYVALLKAGFTVTERYCHSKPVNYVPLGLDATVAYDYLDLRMTNPDEVPCLVRVKARGGVLTADVFGKPAGGLAIEIESRVLKQFPAVVPPQATAGQPVQPAPGETPGGAPGQTPGDGAAQGSGGQNELRDGYLVETIRKYIRDGRVERVERLDTSMYPPEKAKTQ